MKASSDSLREFKTHYNCGRLTIQVYGFTQHTSTKEYMVILTYADKGDLRDYLSSNFCNLNWEKKLTLLYTLSKDLFPIHNAGYTHGDFHSGNILQLSNKSDLNDDIIASSAPASYAAIQYVPNLDTDICSYIADLGLSAPKANQCMDNDSSKRPRIKRIQAILFNWRNIIQGMQGILGDSSAGEIKIKKEFEASDKIIPIFTTTLQKHQEVYRSQRIPNLINYDDEVQKNSSNATDSLENFSISDFD
ncbi:16238_t:CDS:2 [Rhizophagus irregularis]|nr:16238_t:CDS:2 [Rhizophagus irregularis]